MLYLQPKNFSRKTYTDCSWNATIVKHWKNCFQTKKSCLYWTKYNGRRKVCLNFQSDTHKLKFVVNRYRNSLYLTDNEVNLNFTEDQPLLPKRFYPLSFIAILYKQFVVLDETTVHIQNKLRQERMLFSSRAFAYCIRDLKCLLNVIVFAKT